MSPKRRYQTSFGVGLPCPPLPSPEYYSNLHHSYNRPITPAQITVNSCLTSKKIQTNSSGAVLSSNSTNTTTTTNNNASKKGSKPPPDDHHRQCRPSSKQKQLNTTAIGTITSVPNKKGNRTYRVTHHHQHHYEPPQIPSTSTGPGQTRSSSSLSQGIFGLPMANEYFHGESRTDYHHLLEDNHEAETLDDQHPPFKVKARQQKPRMKTTLPSFKNAYSGQQLQHHQESTTPSYLHQQHHHQDLQEDMDGLINVRPVSRQSRTRPEFLSTGGGSGSKSSGSRGGVGGVGGAARRRVQSTSGVYNNYISTNKPSTPISSSSDVNNNNLTQDSFNYQQQHQQQQHHLHMPDLIESILHKLKSQDADWEDIVDGFHSIQRLTCESPSSIKAILRKIIWFGLPHLSSARTKLSRAACQCFKIIYETQRKSMEGEGDKVFQRLLDLCGGQNNKFIQAECKVALLAAIANIDPLKCLQLLEQFGARHKNPNVREFAALLLSKIMESVSPDKLMSKEFAQRILPMMVGFMREGQLNTRLNAKLCLAKIFHYSDFEASLKKYVPLENLRHVQDTLKKFQQQEKQKQQQNHQKSRRATTAAPPLWP